MWTRTEGQKRTREGRKNMRGSYGSDVGWFNGNCVMYSGCCFLLDNLWRNSKASESHDYWARNRRFWSVDLNVIKEPTEGSRQHGWQLVAELGQSLRTLKILILAQQRLFLLYSIVSLTPLCCSESIQRHRVRRVAAASCSGQMLLAEKSSQ